jgi:hypothetical protein
VRSPADLACGDSYVTDSPHAARGPACSQVVNTSLKIGTVQDSYPALSCPVKSPLATPPAPTPPTNSFPFCIRTLSIVNVQRREFRSSLSDFRVSHFDFRLSPLTPLSTAFAPIRSLTPVSTAFTQSHRGVGISTFRLSDVQTCRPLCLCVSVANPLLSYPCDLFAPFFAPLPFVFNRLQPLFPKHPGWGYPLPPEAAQRHLRALLN